MIDRRLRSIYPVYKAASRGKVSGFTVPAFNLRGMTEDLAAGIFQAARETSTALFVLELARSEMRYTGQPPHIFVERILKGAEMAGWDGPIFVQGDHYQVKPLQPGVAVPGDAEDIERLIDESISVGMFNIDIDGSTLVDLSLARVMDQQQANGIATARLATYIREHQPEKMTVSIGGEIGHIGDKNSTEEDLEAFVEIFSSHFPPHETGISKVSVQTGTSHGGMVSAEGKIEKMNVDFTVLNKLGTQAQLHGMAGAVQHGASTLPLDDFELFPRNHTIEIHLATGWQNMIYDNPEFPQSLRDHIYEWLLFTKGKERKENETDAQFYYRMRKYAWGEYKNKFDTAPRRFHESVREDMRKHARELFVHLRVAYTFDMAKALL